MFRRVLLSLLLLSPAYGQQQIVVRGSDAMVMLGQRWSQRLRQIYPVAILQVNGGGPSSGAAALASGRAQVAQTPRKLSAREREAVEVRTHQAVLEFPVAIESVVVCVNVANPVSELTVGELRGIYSGKITNWKEVGGRNEPIRLYSTESAVGGSLYFRETVLGGEEFDTGMRGFSTAKQTFDAVAEDPRGIGFGGQIGSTRSKLLHIRRGSGSPAIEPSTESLRTGRYPLSRYLYWTLTQPLSEPLRKISNWVLSAEGQLTVESIGYYPLNFKDRALATSSIAQAR